MEEAERYIQARLNEVVPRFAWEPMPPSARRRWQDELRLEVIKCLGIGRLKTCPLEPVFESTHSDRGFRRTALTFASQPGYRAFGYYLEPEDSERGGPAIICIPGHGAGVDAIVGLAEEPYQANFALQCVAHGYRVLALEPFSFGHRKSPRNPESSSSCDADAKTALMLGESLAGWRIWDSMRGIDLLRQLPAVDPDRIGIMGISGGGLISLWTAALDPRIKAGVVSGYFCTFRDSILSIDHCLDNFVPGILDLIEMPDFAALIAPRSLFVESGTDDPIFPLAGFQTARSRAEEIYRSSEADDHFGHEVFEGGHEFRGGRAFEFLRERL